jgi:hypothetical protein
MAREPAARQPMCADIDGNRDRATENNQKASKG